MIRTNKKVSIFRQGNCKRNFLHPSLSKSFAAGILWKTQRWDIFTKVRQPNASQDATIDASLEDNYCVPLFKLKFLIPTLRHIFCSPKPWKIYRESDFVSSASRNKLEKYTFLWFRKRDFYFYWEENIREFFQKIC